MDMLKISGLLLMRVFLPSAIYVHDFEDLHLAVCCPRIGKRRTHLLPPPPFKIQHGYYYNSQFTGCALLTDEDHLVDDGLNQLQRQPTFQVLLTYTVNNGVLSTYNVNGNGVYVCTYSSATDGWSAPIRCHHSPYLYSCEPFAGVVVRGTVHWMYTDWRSFYTLNVSTDMAANVSMTKIPISVRADLRVPFPCVSGEGKLSFVNIQDNGALELWTKQGHDDDDHGGQAGAGGWMRSDLINLPSVERIKMVFFAESRGAMLVEQDGAFFTIDLKSREKEAVDLKGEEMEHVGIQRFPTYNCSSSCSRLHDTMCLTGGRRTMCGHNKPVLYELDWVFDGRICSPPLVGLEAR